MASDPFCFTRFYLLLRGKNTIGAQVNDMNSEQFIDEIYNAELQETLLQEEFESFDQAVERAQSFKQSDKTSRASNKERPNYVRDLQGVPKLKIRGHVEVIDAQQVRAELTRLETSPDQRLDQMGTQMQTIMIMMGRFPISVKSNPNPGRNPAQKPLKIWAVWAVFQQDLSGWRPLKQLKSCLKNRSKTAHFWRWFLNGFSSKI